MALTNLSQVTSSGIHTLSNYTTHNINSTGIITASTFSGNLSNSSGISTFAEIRVTGNLTVEGTTTTLDSNLTEVDRIEVGANTAAVGLAVTQSGTGDAAYFMGGDIGINTTAPRALVDFGPGTGNGTLNQTVANYQAVFEAPTGTGNYTRNIAFASRTSEISAAINAVDEGGSDATGLIIATGTAGSIAERIRITSGGDVGIGTDNPISDLHLFRTGDTILTLESDRPNSDENANPKLVFRQDGGVSASAIGMNFDSDGVGNDLFIANSIASGSIRFLTGTSNGFTNASEALRITSAGNIGIGSDAPAERLVVQGNGISNLSYDHDGGGFTSNSGGALVLTGYFDYSGAKLGLYVDNAGQGIIANKTSQNLHIGTNNSKNLTINSVGKIGINETSPDSLLHLKNNAAAGIRAGLRLESSGTNNSANDTMGEILFAHNDSNDAGVSASIVCKAEDVAGNTYLQFNNGKPSALVEYLRITSAGLVGIGTNIPESNSRLHTFTTQTTARTITETSSASGYAGYRLTNGTGYWEMQVDGSNQGLRFLDDGTERLRITSAGELISTNGTLKRNVSDSSFTISGDTASNAGANINLYGASHSSLANVFRVRTGSTERLRIDNVGSAQFTGQDSPSGRNTRISRYGSLLVATTGEILSNARCSIDSGNGNIATEGSVAATSVNLQSSSTSSWFQTGTSLYSTNYVWAAKNSSSNTWHSGLQTDGDLLLGNVLNDARIGIYGSSGNMSLKNATTSAKLNVSTDISGNYTGWKEKGVAAGSMSQASIDSKTPTINDFTYPNSSNGMLIWSTSKIGFAAGGESPQYGTGVQMLFDSAGLILGGNRAFDRTTTSSTASNWNVKLRTDGQANFKGQVTANPFYVTATDSWIKSGYGAITNGTVSSLNNLLIGQNIRGYISGLDGGSANNNFYSVVTHGGMGYCGTEYYYGGITKFFNGTAAAMGSATSANTAFTPKERFRISTSGVHVGGAYYFSTNSSTSNELPNQYNVGNVNANSVAYPHNPGIYFVTASSPCDNTWRTLFTSINDSNWIIEGTSGDASSKRKYKIIGNPTSPSYGVNLVTEDYHTGGWNTGDIEFRLDGTHPNWNLQVKTTSYYNSSNTSGIKFMLFVLY